MRTYVQAYGGIVDDLVQRFIGLGVTPEIDTYRALLVAYGSGGDADKVLWSSFMSSFAVVVLGDCIAAVDGFARWLVVDVFFVFVI